jgi:hypothetical protein
MTVISLPIMWDKKLCDDSHQASCCTKMNIFYGRHWPSGFMQQGILWSHQTSGRVNCVMTVINIHFTLNAVFFNDWFVFRWYWIRDFVITFIILRFHWRRNAFGSVCTSFHIGAATTNMLYYHNITLQYFRPRLTSSETPCCLNIGFRFHSFDWNRQFAF